MGGMMSSPFGGMSSFFNDFGSFGGGSTSIQTFSSSGGFGFGGMNMSSSSTSTSIVNGKKVTTKKVVNNGVETVKVYENDVLKSHRVNGEQQGQLGMDQGKNGKKSLNYRKK